jgi:hypothetical protein
MQYINSEGLLIDTVKQEARVAGKTITLNSDAVSLLGQSNTLGASSFSFAGFNNTVSSNSVSFGGSNNNLLDSFALNSNFNNSEKSSISLNSNLGTLSGYVVDVNGNQNNLKNTSISVNTSESFLQKSVSLMSSNENLNNSISLYGQNNIISDSLNINGLNNTISQSSVNLCGNNNNITLSSINIIGTNNTVDKNSLSINSIKGDIKNSGVAINTLNSLISSDSFASGEKDTIANNNSFAVGGNNNTLRLSAFSVNNSNNRITNNSFAVGGFSEVVSNNSLSFNGRSNNVSSNSLSILNNNSTVSDNSLSIGGRSNNISTSSVSIGNQNSSLVSDTVAIKNSNASINANNSLVLGTKNVTGSVAVNQVGEGTNIVSLGGTGHKIGSNSLVIGGSNHEADNNGIIIGGSNNKTRGYPNITMINVSNVNASEPNTVYMPRSFVNGNLTVNGNLSASGTITSIDTLITTQWVARLTNFLQPSAVLYLDQRNTLGNYNVYEGYYMGSPRLFVTPLGVGVNTRLVPSTHALTVNGNISAGSNFDIVGNINANRNINVVGNVGIGINASSSEKLTVAGNVSATGLIYSKMGIFEASGGAEGGQISLVDPSSNSGAWEIDNFNTSLRFFRDRNQTPTVAMVVVSSGNVGMGTYNPVDKLTVEGNVSFLTTSSAKYIRGYGGSVDNSSYVVFGGTTTGNNSRLIHPLYVSLSSGDGGPIFADSTLDNISPVQGRKFTYGSDDVNRNFLIAGSPSNPQPVGGDSIITGIRGFAYSGNNKFLSYGRGGNASVDLTTEGAQTSANLGGSIVFSTMPKNSGTAVSCTERMRITHDGNVGIGTSGAVSKLDIRPILYSGNQSGGIQLATTTNQWPAQFLLESNNSNVPRLTIAGPRSVTNGTTGTINLSGKIGINNTNPVHPLDVYGSGQFHEVFVTNPLGDTRVEVGGENNVYIDIKKPGANDYDLRIGSGTESSDLPIIQTATGLNLYLNAVNANLITQTNGGNVGINTSTPSSQLHINSANYARISLGNNDSTGFHVAKESSDNSLRFYTGAVGFGTTRMAITSSGRVGIGVANPLYSGLQVNGEIMTSTGWIRTSGERGWYNETYQGGWFMNESSWVRTYNNKSVWTENMLGSNNGLTVGYNGTLPSTKGAIIAGDVGIGTSSDVSSARLTVNGRANSLSLKGGGTNAVYAQFYANSASQATRSAWMGFGGLGSTRLTINNEYAINGVGGTIRLQTGAGFSELTPAGKLHVNGYSGSHDSTQFNNVKLDVNGELRVAGDKIWGSEINDYLRFDGPTDSLRYIANDQEVFRVSSNGTVSAWSGAGSNSSSTPAFTIGSNNGLYLDTGGHLAISVAGTQRMKYLNTGVVSVNNRLAVGTDVTDAGIVLQINGATKSNNSIESVSLSATSNIHTNQLSVNSTNKSQKLVVGGNIYATGELVTSNPDGLRIIRTDNTAVSFYYNGSNFYTMFNDSSAIGATYNSLRPLRIERATGNVYLGNGALLAEHSTQKAYSYVDGGYKELWNAGNIYDLAPTGFPINTTFASDVSARSVTSLNLSPIPPYITVTRKKTNSKLLMRANIYNNAVYVCSYGFFYRYVNGPTYRISGTGFSRARNTSTVTVTLTNHGLVTGDVITFRNEGTVNLAAHFLGYSSYQVTRIDANRFSYKAAGANATTDRVGISTNSMAIIVYKTIGGVSAADNKNTAGAICTRYVGTNTTVTNYLDAVNIEYMWTPPAEVALNNIYIYCGISSSWDGAVQTVIVNDRAADDMRSMSGLTVMEIA